MCMFATVTEGGWQTWGQWKQSAPGVRARIRTKDTQDQCPHKYQGKDTQDQCPHKYQGIFIADLQNCQETQ